MLVSMLPLSPLVDVDVGVDIAIIVTAAAPLRVVKLFACS